MKENKLKIEINKSVSDVFEFTTNPANTHLWIPSIKLEISDCFPPKIGTIYKNHGNNLKWDFYKVVDVRKNELFLLSDLDNNYFVRYTYKKIAEDITEMEYFEWMTSGDLVNPFSQDVLQNLKIALEKKK